MTESRVEVKPAVGHTDTAEPGGLEVFVIAYDEEGNELRLTSAQAVDASDRSGHLGIGRGRREIIRIKHGPFVAAEEEIRLANVGSLAAAIEGNLLGTELIVDRSAPSVDEDMLETDKRYTLDVRSSQLVAVVRERHSRQPNQSETEIASSLVRIADSYECNVLDVRFTLVGGGTPQDFLMVFEDKDGSDYFAQLQAEQLENLAGMAHDVYITVTTDSGSDVGRLIDGATAIADFLKATKNGPLDAFGVLNLLRGGHQSALIGAFESDFFEAKSTMYAISADGSAGDRAKIELAQDVARFANGDVDAVLVVGIKEAKGAGRNEIGSITPVADKVLDLARIGEVLDRRIVPPIDGIVLEKFPVTDSKSLLAIFVPKQPREMQPYLVHGAIAGDKVEGAFISIVRRRGEGSMTTTAQQIHAYIVAGKRYLRTEE